MVKRTLKVDVLGRVTIPKHVRKMLGIDGKDRVEVMYDNTQLIIPKVDVLEIGNSMDKIMNIADNSGAITYNEFVKLNEIFDKLRGELNDI